MIVKLLPQHGTSTASCNRFLHNEHCSSSELLAALPPTVDNVPIFDDDDVHGQQSQMKNYYLPSLV
ncbi:hypothetical protein DERP_010140 [Dermatophagoides pteronyssinus]|uniref:Uncharacterized protein n=1 Tax=Dermatophagoides pteronyssinus TaxID=6956 RepID=A0ABQ8JF13_DERPT|nr:hypothetical protein DERP_010140 [Dermatophagoides pteronyssinus]